MRYIVFMPKTVSLDGLLDRTLPLNRKERYFTGTVLPELVGDNLQHLHRLAELVGVETVDVRTDRDDCTVLLFTEYGISESAIGDAAARFSDLPTGRDTPDVVVLVTDPSPVLIAIEAKLYDRPSRAELVAQLEGQRRLLDPLVNRLGDWLGVEEVVLRHVALLPDDLRAAIEAGGSLGVPVITWEQVRDAWSDIGGYYHDVLAIALERYPDLVSQWAGNQDSEVLGEKLVASAAQPNPRYPWMGRRGGLDGDELAHDITSGTWRTKLYQVRREHLPDNPSPRSRPAPRVLVRRMSARRAGRPAL